MEAMLGRLEPNDNPTRLVEDEPRRHGELVDKRRQRMLQQRHQLNRHDVAVPSPFPQNVKTWSATARATRSGSIPMETRRRRGRVEK
jgi:hypothetical protein